jgi:FAD/FMN-containing dehydrogenase
MDVVLADGSQVVANANSNPDLFWALRGGGAGSFGIVQRFTAQVYPSTMFPQHSMFFIRYGESSDFLNVWQSFFVTAPKELGR